MSMKSPGMEPDLEELRSLLDSAILKLNALVQGVAKTPKSFGPSTVAPWFKEDRRLPNTATEAIEQEKAQPITRAELDAIVIGLRHEIVGSDFHKAAGYVDSQRLATMHNRINKVQEKQEVDLADLQHNRTRILALENIVGRQGVKVGYLLTLGFWGRIRFILFGFPDFIKRGQ